MIMLLIDSCISKSTKGREHAPARYAFISPELQQAKSNCWGYLKHYAGKIPGVVLNASESSATFPNGNTIRLYGASEPDSLRGAYLDGVILDEVAQLPEDLWASVIYPQLTDYKGFAVFCGTANGINLLSKTYFAALQKPDRWFTAFYDVHHTDVFTPDQIKQMQADMDPAKFAREYLCDFSAATENVMITFADCQTAAARHYTPDQFQFAPIILGIDIARQGEDRSACVLRQGLFMDKPWIWKIPDTMELAARIALIIQQRKPDAVFIDGSGGYGAGVIDRLRSLNHNVTEVQFGGKADGNEYLNKRAEMWGRLAKWVKETGHIPNIPELFQDLCGPTYSHDMKDRVCLEGKDEMKKRGLMSPDLGDACALSFSYHVAQKQLHHFGILGQAESTVGGTLVSDYDALDCMRGH